MISLSLVLATSATAAAPPPRCDSGAPVARIAAACTARGLPGRPRRLRSSRADGRRIRLRWAPARRGRYRIVGYRVFNRSHVLGQSRRRARVIRVASNRRYVLRVAAVDSRGRVGPRSRRLIVRTRHRAPRAPRSLRAVVLGESEVALQWRRSRVRRGRVVGYRIVRDGRVVRQQAATTGRVAGLAPGSTHRFQVVAVDNLGYRSAPSRAVAVRTHDPAPTAGHAHAYVLASTDRSFADLRAHYRQIGTIYPTYYDCTSSAGLVGRDDPLITSWSRARRIRVLPRINCQRTAALTRLLRDPVTRASWLDSLTALAGRYDGLSLDFEAGAAEDRDAYSAFVAALAQRLHARGKSLSVAASAKTRDDPGHPRSGFYDYPALAKAADHVVVMAWGLHWTTSGPGPSDDIRWVTNVAAYVRGLGTPRKFILGTPFYATDWPQGAGPGKPAQALEFDDLRQRLAATRATVEHDPASDSFHARYSDAAGVPHDIWYGDAGTTSRRIRLASAHGLGGIAFWRLGREDQRLWADPQLAPGAPWR
jgi:spore germination protein YaaH